MAKGRIADLAVFGGEPAFGSVLHIGRPNIGDRSALLSRINTMLDNRWLSNDGPFLQELERRLAELLGTRHCVAVANATLGLQLVAEATGLRGEVIIPSFTFIATAHALAWQGLKPVFCDIDPETHNIDPARVEALITSRTTAIMGVHLWGRACDIDALQALSRRYGLHLLFDAAHALGCSYQGRMIGGFGEAEVFSFHATKFFNSFEGGAIATNDDALAERLRQMRNFGYDDESRTVALGINAKMHEASAVMGLTSLESLTSYVATNYQNLRAYREHLADVPGISIIEHDNRELHNYQYVVLEIDEAGAGLSRDDLLQVLRAERVLARRYFSPPCHLAYPYHGSDAVRTSLHQTELVSGRVFQLPTGTAVGPDEIARIAELIRFTVDSAAEVKRRLPALGRVAMYAR
jgi:dTDP-4-amino-4,6-dideoxygalactose transaminase